MRVNLEFKQTFSHQKRGESRDFVASVEIVPDANTIKLDEQRSRAWLCIEHPLITCVLVVYVHHVLRPHHQGSNEDGDSE